MLKYKFLALIVILLIGLVPGQSIVSAQEPVVHAVIFYSPSCGHCEKVITQDIPPLLDKYGNQFVIIGIDVSQEGGSAFYNAAVERFSIPQSRLGVPTLIVSETVLVGSGEIPEQLPLIIEETLKSGGNDWPDIPGLKEALIAQGAIPAEDADPEAPSEAATNTPMAATAAPAEPGQPRFVSVFMQDPLANTISVVLLVAMIAVVIFVAIAFIRDQRTKILNGPKWIIPVLALIGLGIAAYMSYVEVTRTDAVCGPIGDCNTVQDSIYAKIFGVSVGIIGIAGYLAIMAGWLVQIYGPENLKTLAKRGIWTMGWFGILFSIYLTFLEPFVIGASCAWCLSSAAVMTLIFWFSTGPAQETWQDSLDTEFNEEEKAEKQKTIGVEVKNKGTD